MVGKTSILNVFIHCQGPAQGGGVVERTLTLQFFVILNILLNPKSSVAMQNFKEIDVIHTIILSEIEK